MRCVFRTNPCKGLQDDYAWYRLEDTQWEIEPNSGNSPRLYDAVDIPRAFSTIRTNSSFFVLLRNKGKLSLCAGAPTLREEVGQHHRPIKGTLYLLAESPADEVALCGFAEQCLSVDDAEGLGNPRSDVGAAVDEIWATQSLQNFMAKFGGSAMERGRELIGCESWVYPRQDIATRRIFAQKVRLAVTGPRPFLVALTDRTPSEALSELRSFTGPSVVFSSRIASAQKVASSDFPQSPFPFNRTGAKIAAVAAVAMIVWAILPGGSEKGSEPSQKIAEESQKTQSCTNLPPKAVKSCETNSADCLGDSVMTGKNK